MARDWTPYKVWDETDWYAGEVQRCAVCERRFHSDEGRFPVGRPEVHHLVPKHKYRGKPAEAPTILVCHRCHRQLHRLYDNPTLKEEYSSVKKLKDDPEVKKFVNWLKKEKPGPKG